MVDVFAGISAFNAMFNIAKTLREMDNAVARETAVIDLLRQINATEQEYSALLKTKGDLEAKIVSFENWESEKQRYQPQKFEPGVTVYVLKPSMEGAEHGQHFCPNCYANRKARILQGTDKTFAARQVRDCHACKVELAYGPQEPQPDMRRSRGSWV